MLVLVLLAVLSLLAIGCAGTAIVSTLRNPVDYSTYRRGAQLRRIKQIRRHRAIRARMYR